MKVVFTYDYGISDMKRIRDLGYEVTIISEHEITNTKEVNEADVLVCYNPFSKIDVSKMTNLKLIMLSSIGFDQLPFKNVEEQGITVTNNKGGYSIPMGEWIVMNILEIYKRSRRRYKCSIEKRWSMDTEVLEIFDKNVLFLGTGTIAMEGAKRLAGFGMHITGASKSGRTNEIFANVIKLSEAMHNLDTYDIVVCTLPHTEETEGLIDGAFLDGMKVGSALINVSRGDIVDEKALIKCLKSDKLLGVALDVFEHEPLSEDSELWDFDNVYLSSHNSWISERRNSRRFQYIYRNLKSYIEGSPLINVVDVKRGY